MDQYRKARFQKQLINSNQSVKSAKITTYKYVCHFLERKIHYGHKLTWQQNVTYDDLQEHQRIIEAKFRQPYIKQVILELVFDQPAIDCYEFGFISGCRIHYNNNCPKRLKWKKEHTITE